MTNMVKIDGVTVDADDPCALWQVLYSAKLKMISGEIVQEMTIQSPVTRETVVFSPGKLGALDQELNRLAAACQAKTSGRRPSRRWQLKF
ncbi:hypothetical protein [Ciceribacter ferrooxidans]|uniref:Uncharacterized protein n=1 Tax=Ciceribacter ferrooxidans TaxID=2509717 RepID=A0A4Q2SVP1_9HYPH|nr:hypothetical protein [Ciceribacter ferrooxidans]RYC10166.1 hypothetical protein EUU22_19055 [Ciceribacter ferrooxidans]